MKYHVSKFLEKHLAPFESCLKFGRRSGNDRRSTETRRATDSGQYLINGGIEKRTGAERRQINDRRIRWVPPIYWKNLIFR